MAQLVAHSLWERGVVSSSLATPTIFFKGSVMKFTRIFSSLFFILSFSSSIFSSQAISSSEHIIVSEDILVDVSHAKAWAAACAEQMTPEQLRFTANFLYNLYANALIDMPIQGYYTHLLELSQAVRHNLSDPLSANQEVMYLRALTNKIACTTKIRLVHTQILDTCLHYYDQHKDVVIEAALKDLQLYASEKLFESATQEQEKTTALLEQSSQALLETAQHIYASANLHRGLRDGQLPFHVEKDEQAAAVFNIILKNTTGLNSIIDKATNALQATANQAMKIVFFGAATYKEHYQALYDIMSTDTFDKEYATIMFGPDGLLAPEYKTLLPHADDIFEYMLAATQLFEQINREEIHYDN